MIAIIDYKAGNAPSVYHATSHLGYEAVFARSPQDLENASHIILPGVGSAKATIDSLHEMNILNALEEAVFKRKILFLGICVGLQILFDHSEEENTACLGWLKGRIIKFDPAEVRVPQMGWNNVQFIKSTAVAARNNHFYFVNSYHAKPDDETVIWGISDYDKPFTAAVNKDNIFAAQFHIEKSGEAGLELLNNFLKL